MRLVVVVEAIPPYCGGGEQVAWIQAVEMAKNHDVTVITFGDSEASFSREGVTVKTLPVTRRQLIYYCTSGRAVLNDIVSAIKPDVVHHHMPNVLSACIKKGSWLTISTIHDSYQLSFPSYQMDEESQVEATSLNSGITKKGLGVATRAQYAKFKAIRWFNVRKSDIVTCVSRHSRGTMRMLYPKHKNKFVFIPNPIYDRFFEPISSHDGDYVLNVGRQVEFKMGVLLDVARAMQSVRFMFVGTGPMVGKSDQRNVHFCGFSERVDQYIDGAAVCVFPSKSENFPLVGLEAMARGKAVIAARPGFEEYITHGIDGYLLDSTDDKTITNALREVLDDRVLRHRLGMAARLTAEAYKANAVVSMYLRLYEKALNGGVRHALQECGE